MNAIVKIYFSAQKTIQKVRWRCYRQMKYPMVY